METLKCRQAVHCSKVDQGIFIGLHDTEDEYMRKDLVMNHECEKAKNARFTSNVFLGVRYVMKK